MSRIFFYVWGFFLLLWDVELVGMLVGVVVGILGVAGGCRGAGQKGQNFWEFLEKAPF